MNWGQALAEIVKALAEIVKVVAGKPELLHAVIKLIVFFFTGVALIVASDSLADGQVLGQNAFLMTIAFIFAVYPFMRFVNWLADR